jgi:hypothetical protein
MGDHFNCLIKYFFVRRAVYIEYTASFHWSKSKEAICF